MTAALPIIAGELIRTQAIAPEGGSPREIKVSLTPVLDLNRSRGVARFNVSVELTWRVWAGLPASYMEICDTRGYLVEWSMANVAAWLTKVLPGVRCVVSIAIVDAAKMGPRWTDVRVAAYAEKLAAIDPEKLRAMAVKKRAAAAKIAEGLPRQVELMNSSWRLEDIAQMVDDLRAGALALPVE